MEQTLGIAPGGTYDIGIGLDWKVLRLKAVRCAMLKYCLLVRKSSHCNCGRCQVAYAYPEDEP